MQTELFCKFGIREGGGSRDQDGAAAWGEGLATRSPQLLARTLSSACLPGKLTVNQFCLKH